jgi:hypothetical protein
VLGAALGRGPLLVLAAGIATFAALWSARGRPPAPTGATRTALEIVVPGIVGWLALGGPRAVPAPLGVEQGWTAAVVAWSSANWAAPAALLAFAVVYHGATAGGRRRPVASGRRAIWLGYLAAIAILAVLGQALFAGAVALLFAVQWPFQAALQAGKRRWHLLATQGFAMAAMLAALLGAGLAMR